MSNACAKKEIVRAPLANGECFRGRRWIGAPLAEDGKLRAGARS